MHVIAEDNDRKQGDFLYKIPLKLNFMKKKGENRLKRILSLLLTVSTLISLALMLVVPSSAIDDPVVENVEGAYVYNFENDQAIYEYNSKKKIFPTSAVKLMTGILAVEELGDRLDEKVTLTEEMLKNAVGSKIGLKAGEVISIKDIVWSLLVGGGNDSAYVVSHLVSGDASKFVTKMNTRARELGALNTNYTNPTGMHDDNMYTTVEDTAIIARHAYTLSLFMEGTSSTSYSFESKTKTIGNRNALLYRSGIDGGDGKYIDNQARGMNAGSTPQGGHCVVTTANNGELSYLIVVMGGKTVDDTIYSYTNASMLIDWAFEAYNYIEVLSPNIIICEIPVTLSSVTDFVNLVSVETLNVYLPSDVDPATAIELSYVTHFEEIQAPVEKGQVLGSVTAIYEDRVLGTSDIVATADVARSELLYTFHKIEQFSKSKFFIATVVSAVVLTVIYILGNAFLRGRKVKRRY